MPDREKEVADLARATADVVDGERRVSEQILRIERLRADGHDISLAEDLLRSLDANLAQWVAHRDQVVRRITMIDTGLA